MSGRSLPIDTGHDRLETEKLDCDMSLEGAGFRSSAAALGSELQNDESETGLVFGQEFI